MGQMRQERIDEIAHVGAVWRLDGGPELDTRWRIGDPQTDRVHVHGLSLNCAACFRRADEGVIKSPGGPADYLDGVAFARYEFVGWCRDDTH